MGCVCFADTCGGIRAKVVWQELSGGEAAASASVRRAERDTTTYLICSG